MRALILVCDVYVRALAACTTANAAAVFEAPPAMIDQIVDSHVTIRDTAYRERVKIIRKYASGTMRR